MQIGWKLYAGIFPPNKTNAQLHPAAKEWVALIHVKLEHHR